MRGQDDVKLAPGGRFTLLGNLRVGPGAIQQRPRVNVSKCDGRCCSELNQGHALATCSSNVTAN